MVQRGYGSGFLLESLAVLLFDLLDSNNSAKAGVTSFPHFSHASGADGGQDFVWAEFASG